MRLRFWQQPLSQNLSDLVKKTLMTQFSLDSQMVHKLRLLSKKGRFASRPAKFIRIFDPGLIGVGQTATLNYDGLLQIQGHQKALFFEGHTEKIDDVERVFLSDRRTP